MYRRSIQLVSPPVPREFGWLFLIIFRPPFRFAYLRTKAPFDRELVMDELLKKMNEIPGLSFGREALGKKPAFPLQLLAPPDALQKFKAAVEWMIGMSGTK
jgi:hypothetical protein